MFKDIKYLLAYLGPLSCFLAISKVGHWSFAATIFLFGLLPFFELFLKGTKKNLSEAEESIQESKSFFDFMLYLNLPILLTLIVMLFNRIEAGHLSTYEIAGITLGVGIMIGTIGINVAHELGHRSKFFDLFVAKSLLMTAFYIHFNIEHNRGHHKFVATPEDPSSARYKESIYSFWIRSITGVYIKAWQLEHHRLDKLSISRWSIHNEMIRIHFIQLAYVATIVFIWSWAMVPYALVIALIGVLLLESVNYIEHYGLRRKLKPSKRYEVVGPQHSWNSNHDLGRIFLYELTRHSDHHYKATRKYQVLRHFEESPELPTGYPGSIIVSLLPPLWFKIMDNKLASYNITT